MMRRQKLPSGLPSTCPKIGWFSTERPRLCSQKSWCAAGTGPYSEPMARLNLLDMNPATSYPIQNVRDALFDSWMRGDPKPEVRTSDNLDTTPKILPPTPQSDCVGGKKECCD